MGRHAGFLRTCRATTRRLGQQTTLPSITGEANQLDNWNILLEELQRHIGESTVVPAAREFGFKLHCLDFLGITPCFADHGRPPGDDSPNFFSQNSIVPDIRNDQYGALSSIAVTPNLCLAEVRLWLDRLPASQQREVTVFYQRWTQFLKDNYPLWRQTHHIGDNPAPGGIEIYGHAAGGHGFVFVVNANFWSDVVRIPLDERLGFSAQGSCEIVELHPTERLVGQRHFGVPL